MKKMIFVRKYLREWLKRIAVSVWRAALRIWVPDKDIPESALRYEKRRFGKLWKKRVKVWKTVEK